MLTGLQAFAQAVPSTWLAPTYMSEVISSRAPLLALQRGAPNAESPLEGTLSQTVQSPFAGPTLKDGIWGWGKAGPTNLPLSVT